MDKKALVSLIVELIDRDPKVRGAVMRCAYHTPGVVGEYSREAINMPYNCQRS